VAKNSWKVQQQKKDRKTKFSVAFSPPHNQLLEIVAAAKNRHKCASEN
jgi:hypothetical protein